MCMCFFALCKAGQRNKGLRGLYSSVVVLSQGGEGFKSCEAVVKLCATVLHNVPECTLVDVCMHGSVGACFSP